MSQPIVDNDALAHAVAEVIAGDDRFRRRWEDQLYSAAEVAAFFSVSADYAGRFMRKHGLDPCYIGRSPRWTRAQVAAAREIILDVSSPSSDGSHDL